MLTFNHKILTILLIAISINFSGCNKSSEKGDSFELRQGDLLFQDLDCGPFCDAIEKVTQGYNGANFSHIGFVSEDSIDNFVFIEAQPTGVDTTHLEVFLRYSLDLSGQPRRRCAPSGQSQDRVNDPVFVIPG